MKKMENTVNITEMLDSGYLMEKIKNEGFNYF